MQPAVLVESEQRVPGNSPTTLPICSTASFLPSPAETHRGCQVPPSSVLHLPSITTVLDTGSLQAAADSSSLAAR